MEDQQPPRVMLLVVGVELLPADDPTMVGYGIAAAVKDGMGQRQGLVSMLTVSRAPIETLLEKLAEDTRITNLSGL